MGDHPSRSAGHTAMDAMAGRLARLREALALEETRRRTAEATAQRARDDADDLLDLITSERAMHEDLIGRAERVRALAAQHLADTRPDGGRRPILGALAGGHAVAHLAELVLAELGPDPKGDDMPVADRVTAAWSAVLDAVRARSRARWANLTKATPRMVVDGVVELVHIWSGEPLPVRPEDARVIAAALDEVLGGQWKVSVADPRRDLTRRDTPEWPGIEPKEHARPWTSKETPA